MNHPNHVNEGDPLIDPDAYAAMVQAASDGAKGPHAGWGCTIDPSACIHVQRMGAEGANEQGRVTLAQGAPFVLLRAKDARQLASALLNAADEIDGKTVLSFFPREGGEGEQE